MKKKNEEQEKNKTGGKRVLVGGIFVLGILIGVVIFINKSCPLIKKNLKETGFFDKLNLPTPDPLKYESEEPDVVENTVAPFEPLEIKVQENVDSKTSLVPLNQHTRDKIDSAVEEVQDKPAEQETRRPEPESVKKQDSVKQNQSALTMQLHLYFMKILDDGTCVKKDVVRTMPKSDGPLVDSINALIAGPASPDEKNFIPAGTRLLGASVKDGVAILNFSEEFEFNKYGIEGLKYQLQQVIWTATSFPTVKSVQFLINGEKRDYLSEGIYIWAPMTRSFN